MAPMAARKDPIFSLKHGLFFASHNINYVQSGAFGRELIARYHGGMNTEQPPEPAPRLPSGVKARQYPKRGRPKTTPAALARRQADALARIRLACGLPAVPATGKQAGAVVVPQPPPTAPGRGAGRPRAVMDAGERHRAAQVLPADRVVVKKWPKLAVKMTPKMVARSVRAAAIARSVRLNRRPPAEFQKEIFEGVRGAKEALKA